MCTSNLVRSPSPWRCILRRAAHEPLSSRSTRCPWSLRVDVHDDRARSLAALERNRLETEAEIAARDPAVALEHRHDALDRARWNDEHPPTWSEHRHANRLAGHIEREAAFGALPQARIKLDASVDLAAAHGFPGTGGAGHHTKRGGRRTIFGAHAIASMPAETADVPSKTGWRPVR